MTGQESTVISITKDEATESPNAGTGQFVYRWVSDKEQEEKPWLVWEEIFYSR